MNEKYLSEIGISRNNNHNQHIKGNPFTKSKSDGCPSRHLLDIPNIRDTISGKKTQLNVSESKEERN